MKIDIKEIEDRLYNIERNIRHLQCSGHEWVSEFYGGPGAHVKCRNCGLERFIPIEEYRENRKAQLEKELAELEEMKPARTGGNILKPNSRS